MGRRDKPHRERQALRKNEFVGNVVDILNDIQRSIYEKAVEFRNAHTVKIDSKADFYDFFTPENRKSPEIHGGFALCHWNGSSEVEAQVKQEMGVTIRCIPFDEETKEEGKCIISGEKSSQRVVFAKAY